MAKVAIRGTVTASVLLELTEDEAGALDAISGYGADEFLNVFYSHLGRAYLSPYEKGIRSLFEALHSRDASMQSFLDHARDARRCINGTHVAREEPSPR